MAGILPICGRGFLLLNYRRVASAGLIAGIRISMASKFDPINIARLFTPKYLPSIFNLASGRQIAAEIFDIAISSAGSSSRSTGRYRPTTPSDNTQA